MNRLPVVVTLLVALCAAVLAAVATAEVAVTTGAVSVPALGWLIPLIIEGGALTAGVLAWARNNRGLSARPERAALAVLMSLAVWVNASHASGERVLGVVLAAAPPVVLIASVEMLLHRNRGEQVSTKRPVSTESPRPVSTERPRPVSAKQVSTESPRPVSTERPRPVSTERPRPVSTEQVSTERPRPVSGWTALSQTERRALVDQALADEPGITGTALAARVGCGASTARRLLADARAA